MPMVNKNTYNQLIQSRNKKDIIIPIYKGQQGNPVLFSMLMREKIMSIQGDAGAKKILKDNEDKIFNLEINDSGISQDFNTADNFIL